MRSPFHRAARQLWEAGWSVMPLMKEQKRPFLDNWTRLCSERVTEVELRHWESKPQEMNIGVCLGAASGLMALDFDDDIDGLHAKIANLIPVSPLRKTGSKGYTAFYRYDPAITSRGFSKSGVRVLDILSDGRQTVLPPSVHPDGSVYAWIDKTPADVAISDLPILRLETFHDIVKFFKVDPVAPIKLDNGWSDPDIQEAAYTISFIDPDHGGYDMWIHVGMALKDEFGDGAYDLFDQWSASGSKYQGRKETRQKWDSFKNIGISYGTIVMHAMSNPNFVPPWNLTKNREIPNPIIPGSKLDNNPKPVSNEFAEASAIIIKQASVTRANHASFMRAPGLVGEIAQWINTTSRYPQPALAMGVAISVAGTLLAHKVQTETKLRTNIYCAGLAPSGGGKNHGVLCAKHLLSAVGMRQQISGKPKSGTALINGLSKRSGIQFLPWDEFGMAIEALNNPRAGSFQREILSLMTELFSAAGSVYYGDEYANADGKRPAIDVEQPNLCVYGASTEEQFYSALGSKEALNGFLPRWLIFHSEDYAVDSVTAPSITEIPESLLATARGWAEHPTNSDPSGNLDELTIRPRVIPMDRAARELWESYSRDKRALIADDRNNLFNPLLARAAEHAAKIALCAHEGDSITLDVMTWAIGISELCLSYAVRAGELNMADNEHEANVKRMKRTIDKLSRKNVRSKGWVVHGELSKASQNLTRHQRNEILHGLLESGYLESRSERAHGVARGKAYIFYRVAGIYEPAMADS